MEEKKKEEKRNDGNRYAVRSGGRAPISSALTDAESNRCQDR